MNIYSNVSGDLELLKRLDQDFFGLGISTSRLFHAEQVAKSKQISENTTEHLSDPYLKSDYDLFKIYHDLAIQSQSFFSDMVDNFKKNSDSYKSLTKISLLCQKKNCDILELVLDHAEDPVVKNALAAFAKEKDDNLDLNSELKSIAEAFESVRYNLTTSCNFIGFDNGFDLENNEKHLRFMSSRIDSTNTKQALLDFQNGLNQQESLLNSLHKTMLQVNDLPIPTVKLNVLMLAIRELHTITQGFQQKATLLNNSELNKVYENLPTIYDQYMGDVMKTIEETELQKHQDTNQYLKENGF